MSKRLPTTPRSRIKNALRQVWLRSRERAAALKREHNTCEHCHRKASTAKGKEFKVQVHHRNGCNWDGVVDAVVAAMLPPPEQLEVLCPDCHCAEHAKQPTGGNE